MPTRSWSKGLIWGNESGQSAVEFLFMVPFLIMILTMSAQYYLVHRAKFDAVVEHRNNAIRQAMKYNASPGSSLLWIKVPPVEKPVSIVIGSKAFPNGLKVSSSNRDYLIYMGTGRH